MCIIIDDTHVICISSRTKILLYLLAATSAADNRGIAGRKSVVPIVHVCVGTAGDVGEGELVAKVCEISVIFANSDACKSADSNTASSILSPCENLVIYNLK